jgi:GntR family transcriptional regulator
MGDRLTDDVHARSAGLGPIDRTSKVPLYHQLYAVLRANIVGGAWRPGEMIPAESELVAHYGISRTTVRQVLALLVKERLIFRQRGRGSFVAHPTVEQGLTRIISFTEDMRRRGFRPGTRVLAAEIVPAAADIAGQLQIAPGEELALLRRLRLADGDPLSIEESYLVHRHCRGVLERDYALEPLREALERDHGIRLVRARQIIRATGAPRDVAALLGVPVRAPLLVVERVSFSQQDVAVEFLHCYHRGDRYTLHNELQG